MSNHHRADDGLDCAGRSQHVACRRLGRADVDVLGGIAEHGLDRSRLVEVVGGRRRSVRVDVLDVSGLETSVLESPLHGALRSLTIRGGSGQVIRVASRAVSHNLGVDSGAAV